MTDGHDMGNDRHVEGGPRDEDLLVLLEDLAEKHGRMEASKLLGVNNKTLASNLNSGQLTKRVREALELYQLRDVVELGRDEAPDVEEDSSLPEMVEALSRQLSDLKERVDRSSPMETLSLPETGTRRRRGPAGPRRASSPSTLSPLRTGARRPNSLSSGGHYAWLTRTGTTEA